MKKILLTLILLLPFNVFALEISANSAILMDYDTKTIIKERNKDKELPIASMTKMMTMLLIMEKLDNKEISLNDNVNISSTAASMGGSQVYLSANTTYKLEVLLKAVAIASANDAAVALAEHVAGSKEEFVKLMNEKAASLGLKHTSFKNVHGLDEEGHFSSAYDMAIIASELIKHESILKYTSTYEDYVTHPNGTNTWIVNTNKLINYYEGVDGLKTGFTDKAGYCITVTAKKNNLRLIAVVIGEENNKIRNQDIITLLNYGFTNYKLETIVDKKEDLGTINVEFGKKDKVDLTLKENVVDLINKLDKNNYKYKLELNKIKAPVKVGDNVGKLILYANNTKIDEYDLTIKEDVLKANLFGLFRKNLINFLKGTL